MMEHEPNSAHTEHAGPCVESVSSVHGDWLGFGAGRTSTNILSFPEEKQSERISQRIAGIVARRMILLCAKSGRGRLVGVKAVCSLGRGQIRSFTRKRPRVGSRVLRGKTGTLC